MKNKALFLDRDGVINVERGYVYRREDFCFQDGIFDLCRAAQRLGYLLFVVTNQAGIARGYYSESEYLELTQWMLDQFESQDITVAKVYHCPFHPVHGLGPYKFDSPDRKPKPGMLLRAQSEFDLDMSASALIGDNTSDVAAAQAAGVGTVIWLRPHNNACEGVDAQCHLAEDLNDIRARFFVATALQA